METLQVCKSNALIEAAYRLTLAEHKILLACIAQVRRDEPINAEKLYEIHAQQVAERSGVSRQAAYIELKAASERLFERHVTVHSGPDGKPPSIRKFRWVQQVEYIKDTGLVRVQFSSPILPYLAELTERFTVYPIADVSKLTSVHAIRLYELLIQWKGIWRREVELDWLRKAFMIEDAYKSISDLKKYVIEIAVQQINEHTPLHVTWSHRKTGRRVTHIQFSFVEKATEKKADGKSASAKKKTAEGPQSAASIAASAIQDNKSKTAKAKSPKASSREDDLPESETQEARQARYQAAMARKAGLEPVEVARKARPGESWETAVARIAREKRIAAGAEVD